MDYIKNLKAVVLVPLAAFTIASCSSKPVDVPVAVKSQRDAGTHVVEAGETLFSLAWRYGWDYRSLAAINGIDSSQALRPGEIIRFKSADADRLRASNRTVKKIEDNEGAPVLALVPHSQDRTAKTIANQPVQTYAIKEDEVYSKPQVKTVASATNTNKNIKPITNSGINWMWPADGGVLNDFAAKHKKGIDIGGNLGSPIKSTADGEVVYAGSGLRGYGNMVIVKHSDEYLSAYAHNSRLLVKEGEKVKVGQKIAEMGNSEAKNVKLHFEIRYNGKPVDPARYLPKKQVS